MVRFHLSAAALLLGLVPVAHAQPAATPAKKLYCWTEGGRKVCGDALPTTAVDSPRVEINARSGLPTAQFPRALTPAERVAAEAQAQLDRDAANAADGERRRLMAMVESFQTEADLRRAFENRIALSGDSLKTARMGAEGLRENLVDLLRRAGQIELAGKPVPKKLVTDIRAQHGQLLRQQQQLVRLQRDAAEIRLQLEDAVRRYRELKQVAPGPAATPAAD